jgi:hypothetical protein
MVEISGLVVYPEGITYPLDPGTVQRAIQGQDVETQRGRIARIKVIGKEMAGGLHDPSPFAGGDAGGRAAEGLAGPITDLDQRKDIAIAHDQVDFAATATVIGLHKA